MPVLKLAVLGLDAQIEMLLDAARRRGDEIVIACDVAADDPRLAGVPRADAWEAIVDHRGSDAVLVGHDGWNEQRAEGVRKLVQAGRTILLSQPIDLSMLFAYELEMIRRDSGARMIPFLPERLHPYLATLRREIEASLASAGSIGSIEAVECTRRMGDRSRDIVLAQLARDGDLVRGLIGDPERISTLGGGDPERVWNTLSVGFSGAAQVPLRWQVMRGDIAGLTIRLVGTEGSTSVEIPDGQVAEWTLRREPGGSEERLSFDRGDVILGLLHGDTRERIGDTPGPATWDDAARAIELAETVPRSVAKGRGIDLHQEEFSELGTFKGTMASLGCGLVLAALFVLLLATLLGGIAREAGWGFGERIASIWPFAVLAVLGLFLLLQLLPLMIGQDTPPTRGPNGPSEPPVRHE